MLLHDSRRQARVDAAGALVTLEEQDRSLWDREQIAEGLTLVETALRMGRIGAYRLQAAIAALHAEAANSEQTDWKQIAALYSVLARINPSPIVMLNGAVAVAMSEGPVRGLELLDELGGSGELDRYHLFHAARADLLRRLGSFEAAADAYKRALALMANGVERAYLERRLAALCVLATCRPAGKCARVVACERPISIPIQALSAPVCGAATPNGSSNALPIPRASSFRCGATRTW
jgi:RNA polymerase sigma-70 factor (ECF subfamily)